MLTIQPGLVNHTNRVPAFGRGELQRYAEDVDYDEIIDTSEDTFDYENEKHNAKRELALWEQTKANVDSLTKAADNVPVVKSGTKILSGLTAIAIGWGGLRWGSFGTLEVLSKMMKTNAAKSVKTFAENSGKFVSEKFESLKKFVTGTEVYKSAAKKVEDLHNAFLGTSFGKKYTDLKTAITNNSLYKGTIDLTNRTGKAIKDANYKRIFVETMGIAGGGTAAINVLGGKAIDGTKHNVEMDEDGNYLIDGEYHNVA